MRGWLWAACNLVGWVSQGDAGMPLSEVAVTTPVGKALHTSTSQVRRTAPRKSGSVSFPHSTQEAREADFQAREVSCPGHTYLSDRQSQCQDPEERHVSAASRAFANPQDAQGPANLRLE